nr:transposon protein, putative, CACTA, En/Spm sub-class [Ipomoea batatas]
MFWKRNSFSSDCLKFLPFLGHADEFLGIDKSDGFWGFFGKSGSNIGTSSHIEHGEEPNGEANSFYRLLKDFEQPAYPGTDTNPVEYYGVLTEILELQYLGARRVVLFRCRWFNVHDNEKGARVDGYGFTTINPQRILRTNEPFILANQASQVFYAIDNMVKGWHVVIKTQPRDLYKMPQSEEVENDIVENDSIEDLGEAYQYGESFNFKCTGDPVNFDNQNQVINEKSSKNMNNKLPKFLPPGMLAQLRGNRQNSYHPGNGGFSSHTLVMHFEELEFQEKDFNEDSSFLDILNLCKKFVDIYSVGIKVTDGDGRPLKNDRDVLAMVMNHEHVNCIHVYMEVDQNAQPLSFKMPEDNTLAPCVPSNPTVRNIKILGDFKVNKKVKICGTVIGGIEQASTVQLFIAISENFDMEENLKAISESKTEKEFYLPLEAVGHYVVAKYTPMSEDGKFGEPVFVTSNKMVERKIVRDRNICPMQVLSWKDIQNTEKQHMWEAVKGGKDSTPPDLGVIFLKTRCKNEKLDGTREKEKYDEIVKTIMSNPSLSNLEIVEKHFGQQRHGHVYGYGGGVKRKNFNDSKSTYIKELEAKLHEKDEENRNLKRRMDVFESRLIRIENGDLPSLGTTTSDDIQEDA